MNEYFKRGLQNAVSFLHIGQQIVTIAVYVSGKFNKYIRYSCFFFNIRELTVFGIYDIILLVKFDKEALL